MMVAGESGISVDNGSPLVSRAANPHRGQTHSKRHCREESAAAVVGRFMQPRAASSTSRLHEMRKPMNPTLRVTNVLGTFRSGRQVTTSSFAPMGRELRRRARNR
jgi:hypothetical protein